jgi:NAD(P)-dependent dehydrogenase (short-subunit alcohol dehydrogenase family)
MADNSITRNLFSSHVAGLGLYLSQLTIESSMKKTVLVTGCSTGIGRCVAYGLRDKGYMVYPTARRQDDLQALIDDGFEAIALDYSDSDSVERAFNELMQKASGELYAVFHNGAYGQPGAVEDLTRKALEAQFACNVFGWHQLNNLILPIMRQQGYGRIVINSSVLGIIALPMRGAYNASKFALEGLFDTLRLELKNTGIFVSIIEPGPIATEFRANAKKAFEEHIYNNKVILANSAHRQYYEKTIKRLAHKGKVDPFTLPPESVLKRVEHALISAKPKIRYPVTVPTYVFSFLKRVLPHRSLDWILLRSSK